MAPARASTSGKTAFLLRLWKLTRKVSTTLAEESRKKKNNKHLVGEPKKRPLWRG